MKKEIKNLRNEIINLFDKNDEFIQINSIGLKFFDFYIYNNNNYIRYKINLKDKKYKIINSNNKSYESVEYSKFYLMNDIINIYKLIL